jgi:hypothetical protein
MSNLYRGPSKDAFYQISVHLRRHIQRRRFFRNQPIRNKNFLWRQSQIQPTEPLVYFYFRCVRVGMKCPIRAGSGLCRDFTVNRMPPYKKPQVCSSSPFCDCFESSDLYAKMFEICAMYVIPHNGMKL